MTSKVTLVGQARGALEGFTRRKRSVLKWVLQQPAAAQCQATEEEWQWLLLEVLRIFRQARAIIVVEESKRVDELYEYLGHHLMETIGLLAGHVAESKLDGRRITIMLSASRLRSLGRALVTIDLFDLTISTLSKEPGRLEKFLARECTIPKSKLRGMLSRIVDAKSAIIPAIEQQLTDEPHDLIFLSGFGSVFPFLGTKPILEGIQRVMTRKPLVVFYPGEYIQTEGFGSSLRLFGTFPALYYRAFNLDTYHVHPTS